jgi:hypothetical protein
VNNIWVRRVGAAAGAVYILIALLRGSGDNVPAFHASRAAVASWMRHSAELTAGQYAMGLLELLGLFCFLVFVVYLSTLLRRQEGDSGYLSTVVLAAGITSVAIKIASLPGVVVVHIWAKDGVDPRVIGMILDMNSVAFDLSVATLALMVTAAAAVAIPTGALPIWLSWGSAFTAAALLAGSILAFATPDFSPAMLVFMLWTAVTSIVLTLNASETSSPAKAPAGPEAFLAR